MANHLTRIHPPVRYAELARFLPQAADRAKALRVSTRLIGALDAFNEHAQQALPAKRVNLVVGTLVELERRLGNAPAAGRFLMEGDRAKKLFRNGGAQHRAAIIAAAV